MSNFFLSRITAVRCEQEIEGLAIDVMGMRRQVMTNRRREVFI